MSAAAAAAAGQEGPLFAGVDFGTSGARVTVVDEAGATRADRRLGYGDGGAKDWAATWERVLFELLSGLPRDVAGAVAALAIDGTSSTALLVDARTGRALAPPKLYDEAQPADAVAAAAAVAPPAHTATAATSTLCKLLAWRLSGVLDELSAQQQQPQPQPSSSPPAGVRLLHQADWLAFLLHGRMGVSDWNNALKLGFDPALEAYPPWLASQPYAALLPAAVLPPSAPVAPLTPRAAAAAGLPPACVVCAGTTDSIAAFVAAGVTRVGDAVTSLGSTMAVKLLSDRRVDDAAYGVYSHRLGGGAWLVGGASNTGGAVLRAHFSDAALRELSGRIEDPTRPSGLDYYPLLRPGERFPVNDPAMAPRLEPRPDGDDVRFLHGMLEGMARIEAAAYERLAALGASPVTRVLTAGGGARNPQWTAMRAAALGVPVEPAANGEASYGAALLARQGWQQRERERQQQQQGTAAAATTASGG